MFGSFCAKYKLSRSKVASAIRYIELENHWVVEEEGELPTRVSFTMSREDMYSYNPEDRTEDEIIDVLMRRYPGIFSSNVAVDTEYLAKMSECTEGEVKRRLYRLSQKGVIRYIPSDKTPMIYFKENRLMPKNVCLPKARYNERLGRFTGRLDAMIGSVTREDECRSVLLWEYFGEKGGKKCGKCDVCISERNRKRPQRRMMREEIMQFVSGYDFSAICRLYRIDRANDRYWLAKAVSTNEFLSDMIARFGDGYKDCISLLRYMSDAGLLRTL